MDGLKRLPALLLVLMGPIGACSGSPSSLFDSGAADLAVADSSPADLAAGDATLPGSFKPTLRGLADKNGKSGAGVADPVPAAYYPVVTAYVVNVGWAALQPSQGGPLASNNIIDQSIANVRTLNQNNPGLQMRLKLRIAAGSLAPDWAKNIGGAPFTVTDASSGNSGTIGRFWLPAFGAAYNALQTSLAAQYDGVPEILDNEITRCTTLTSEPFLRDIGDASSVMAMHTNGYTLALDSTCHHEQIDAARAWRTTRQDLSFNPYQVINDNGTAGGDDETFTEAMMDYCRGALGHQCVLGNNSLRDPIQTGGYPSMYQHIQTLGPPIYFQTAVFAKVGNINNTLQTAIGYGANFVELNLGYAAVVTPSQLMPYATALAQNPLP